ncbi:Uncharacterised protein [uncultured archaeon]|nr:Uncharacterised protein [uncultured archaeon]
MKPSLTAIVFVVLIMVCKQGALGFQDVGADFGTSWLEQYGSRPASTTDTQNNLWSWGSIPKGYSIYNGVLYPPGYLPQWYYPSYWASSDPIVINNTKGANYRISPSLAASNSVYEDPWMLAQLSGRPVAMINIPTSPLF